MMELEESLGERLARLRKAKGLSQEGLAKLAGVAQSTIGGIEKNARSKQPAALIDIAHALGVDAYYLKYGIRPLVANDMMIDKVVSLMRDTAKEGKAIVLDKAQDVQAQYPAATGKQQMS